MIIQHGEAMMPSMASRPHCPRPRSQGLCGGDVDAKIEIDELTMHSNTILVIYDSWIIVGLYIIYI